MHIYFLVENFLSNLSNFTEDMKTVRKTIIGAWLSVRCEETLEEYNTKQIQYLIQYTNLYWKYYNNKLWYNKIFLIYNKFIINK